MMYWQYCYILESLCVCDHTCDLSFFVRQRNSQTFKLYAGKVRKFATIIASRQNSVNQYWGLKFTLAYSFDWDCVFGVLVAYSFDWDGVLGVLVGVLFWLRWRTWCFGWRILLVEMAYLVFWLAYSFDWDGIFVALIGVLVVFVWHIFL